MASIRVVFFDIGETLVRRNAAGKQVLVSGVLEVIEHIREKGVLTGIISNTGEYTRQELSALLPAEFRFDFFEPELVLLSSELGAEIEKPGATIFAIAYERASRLTSSLSPANCLFCGESPIEILGAQIAGFTGARVLADEKGTELAHLMNELNQLGLVAD